MPTVQTSPNSLPSVDFTAAELNALLIEAASTAIGQTVTEANVYVINDDGEAMRSPNVIRRARVIATAVEPA